MERLLNLKSSIAFNKYRRLKSWSRRSNSSKQIRETLRQPRSSSTLCIKLAIYSRPRNNNWNKKRSSFLANHQCSKSQAHIQTQVWWKWQPSPKIGSILWPKRRSQLWCLHLTTRSKINTELFLSKWNTSTKKPLSQNSILSATKK